MHRPLRPLSIVLCAGLVLAGCIGKLPGTGAPPKIYDLTPKSTFDANLPSVSWQLVVQEPVAAANIDTSRIVARQTPLTLEYYKGVAWVDRAPRMVQTLIIESFERTGKIVAVGREAIGLRSDYVLKPELRDFEADYTKGPVPSVLVRMNVKLIKMPERTIVSNATFESRIEAENTSMEAIVTAYDEALGKVLKRTVEWTLRGGPPT
ncbi:MAG: ABC-type transport auxiliary lipoprotein family protein [Alphaproteobacteria bacterium]|mgnify:CR=1 FL=1